VMRIIARLRETTQFLSILAQGARDGDVSFSFDAGLRVTATFRSALTRGCQRRRRFVQLCAKASAMPLDRRGQ
jgi:hypothetical protein